MATASRTSTMNLIGRLQHQGDSYTRAIDIERERVLSLDKEIGEVRTEIMGLRQERKSFRVYNHVAGGIQAAQETNTNVAKEIKILEHRLNKALIRHSETINGNKKLQEEINYKRQKRLIFNEIYKKILSQLKEKQTSMEMVMKESNMANRQREGALKEEADLREIAAEEQEQFEIEYNELGHYIETQRRMKEHMKATAARRRSRSSLRPCSAASSAWSRRIPCARNWTTSPAT
jgi:chromosome segregation ATPase